MHDENRKSQGKMFFTADFHYNHGNIVKYCNRNRFLAEEDRKAFEENGNSWHDGDWKGPRASKRQISRETIEAMNDAIVDNVNCTVGENDTLYFLGDWCFGGKNNYYQVAREARDRIKCRNVYLIWGNHDHRTIANLFTNCFDLLNATINNQRFVLAHYAMCVWDKSHRGAIQLYGHSHSNLEEWIDKAMPGHLSMDVGIDNAFKVLGEYRPFSIEEVLGIMNKRKGFFPDHHGMRTGPTEEELQG